MEISLCRKEKTMVSANFKRNLNHFNVKKVQYVQFFLFVKYTEKIQKL